VIARRAARRGIRAGGDRKDIARGRHYHRGP
jgi:hypothetical protein